MNDKSGPQKPAVLFEDARGKVRPHYEPGLHGAPSMKPAETVTGEIVPGTGDSVDWAEAGGYDVRGARGAQHDEAEAEDAAAWPAADEHIVYVALSPEMLVQLAREGATTEPLAVVALVPYAGDDRDDTFELVLRQPHRKELWAALGEAPRR